nr:ribonuclease H-like domain-containing protein [Tanacetum cinerariifolium]
VIAAKEFGMIAGANSVEANTLDDAREFALMRVSSEKELGWDDSAFSVFTTTSKDVEGRPTFHRFAKTDSMKVMPPPLTGDYTSLSDHSKLVESQMSYGTKSSTSNDPESVTNDFVSCDDIPTDRTKVNSVPTTKPKVRSVPTGKPKVTSPVTTGRPYRPFPVPTDRGYSPSIMSGWWSHTPSPIHHFTDPTNSYFQSYTPYLPTMYYNNMQYGGDSWATVVKPSAGTSFLATENKGIFYSGCSRSMTGNKDRLDDFQAFHDGEVTFGGSKGRITGKWAIRTPTLDFEKCLLCEGTAIVQLVLHLSDL